MKRIIALIDDNSDREIVIASAVELALLLNIEVTVCHLVIAPSNWEQLNRSSRDKHPTSKLKINEARFLMDEILGEIRLKNLKAKKRFLYFDSTEKDPVLDFQKDELIVMEKKLLNRGRNHALSDLLFNLEPSKLILSAPLQTNSISDIVFTSNFHKINSETSQIINELYRHLVFNLNLVYINTKEKQENSDISINNMKNVIAANGFSRTGISIFHSDQKLHGAELFANMKGGDLIILECSERITNLELSKLNLPIIIINKCEA
ncbi:MAG: hypothetical protein GQ574_00230 [Crocinitomix sp.]|nr:hypothetical protein [Crocinitomix sp.]